MTPRSLGARTLALLAATLFVGLALFRRLNFDESLALRAGWLDIADIPSAPAFLMPWTLLAGGIAHLIQDPGFVFISLRLIASGLVVTALAAAASAFELGPAGLAAASWLAVASASFATHGLEFRYDAAILVLLLLGFALLARNRDLRLVGCVAGVLALHHLKGVFFAVGLVAIALAYSTGRRRDAWRLLAAAAGTWLIWLAVLAPLDLLPRFGDSLRTYFDLASDSTRIRLSETLGPTLLRDLAWWSLVLTAIGFGFWKHRDSERNRQLSLAYCFAALGVAFWIVHPHAWAYLAAIPAPFLALAAVRELARSRTVLKASMVAGLLGLALQAVSSTPLQGFHLWAAANAPMAPEVSLLRSVRAELTPDDRILDPAGLIYFAPPCLREWYVDTLFMEKMTRGSWMAALDEGVPSDCSLALNTYRLGALPAAARRSLASDFLLLRCGLAVRPDRSRIETLATLSGNGRIESYW